MSVSGVIGTAYFLIVWLFVPVASFILLRKAGRSVMGALFGAVLLMANSVWAGFPIARIEAETGLIGEEVGPTLMFSASILAVLAMAWRVWKDAKPRTRPETPAIVWFIRYWICLVIVLNLVAVYGVYADDPERALDLVGGWWTNFGNYLINTILMIPALIAYVAWRVQKRTEGTVSPQ